MPAGGQAAVRVSMVPPRRGLHRVPTLVAETLFPFGLFRAWTLWRPAAEQLAYPRPETPAPPLPASQPLAELPGLRWRQLYQAGTAAPPPRRPGVRRVDRD